MQAGRQVGASRATGREAGRKEEDTQTDCNAGGQQGGIVVGRQGTKGHEASRHRGK